MVEHARVPEHLRKRIVDPGYGEKQPLFRRMSGHATITIFDGGHELVPEAAMAWIQSVYRSKQGKNSRPDAGCGQ